MRNLIPAIILGAVVLGYQTAKPDAQSAPQAESMASVAASTYEHLASAIIEIEKTEDELVRSILTGYHTVAQSHLHSAGADAANRVRHLEAAAEEVSNIANEGDKPIQAIRQRLAKAGHTHNTDVETKADYMFITNREKKRLVDLASRIGRAGAQATPAEIAGLASELAREFHADVAPE